MKALTTIIALMAFTAATAQQVHSSRQVVTINGKAAQYTSNAVITYTSTTLEVFYPETSTYRYYAKKPKSHKVLKAAFNLRINEQLLVLKDTPNSSDSVVYVIDYQINQP